MIRTLIDSERLRAGTVAVSGAVAGMVKVKAEPTAR
jgi:hypothetical protein